MTPDERLELESCLRRVGEILYANSEPDSLETLEDIEKKVREQVLTEVSPKITFFFSKKRQEQRKGKKEKSKAR